MTVQLDREKEIINTFAAYCKANSIQIIREYKPSENKLENTDSDFDIRLPGGEVKSVSLKSSGGLMTDLNGGAGSRSASKWMTPEEVALVKEAEKEMNVRRKTVSSQYARWADVPNSSDVKYFVIEPLLEAWFSVLSSNVDAVKRLSALLTGRKSDLLFVEDKFVPYTAFSGTEVSKINSKSILVGNYEIRFKTEGGKTSSSIKLSGNFKK